MNNLAHRLLVRAGTIVGSLLVTAAVQAAGWGQTTVHRPVPDEFAYRARAAAARALAAELRHRSLRGMLGSGLAQEDEALYQEIERAVLDRFLREPEAQADGSPGASPRRDLRRSFGLVHFHGVHDGAAAGHVVLNSHEIAEDGAIRTVVEMRRFYLSRTGALEFVGATTRRVMSGSAVPFGRDDGKVRDYLARRDGLFAAHSYALTRNAFVLGPRDPARLARCSLASPEEFVSRECMELWEPVPRDRQAAADLVRNSAVELVAENMKIPRETFEEVGVARVIWHPHPGPGFVGQVLVAVDPRYSGAESLRDPGYGRVEVHALAIEDRGEGAAPGDRYRPVFVGQQLPARPDLVWTEFGFTAGP